MASATTRFKESPLILEVLWIFFRCRIYALNEHWALFRLDRLAEASHWVASESNVLFPLYLWWNPPSRPARPLRTAQSVTLYSSGWKSAYYRTLFYIYAHATALTCSKRWRSLIWLVMCKMWISFFKLARMVKDHSPRINSVSTNEIVERVRRSAKVILYLEVQAESWLVI